MEDRFGLVSKVFVQSGLCLARNPFRNYTLSEDKTSHIPCIVFTHTTPLRGGLSPMYQVHCIIATDVEGYRRWRQCLNFFVQLVKTRRPKKPALNTSKNEVL